MALPFTAGPALAAGMRGASGAVQTLSAVTLWVGWSLGVLAALVPRPVSLTALRLLAPASLILSVAAGSGTGQVLAVAWSAVTCAWAFSPAMGSWCVNGGAYPNERRFLLRAPGPLLAGPIAVAWAMAAAGIGSGPWLLATRHWAAGALATLVGFPVAAVLVRSLHTLALRWVVFVPAGVVLHDPVALCDPFLFRRAMVVAFGPAPASTDALDLTQRSPGLALELDLDSPADMTLQKPGRREGVPTSTSALLFTPTRPGAVLEEAATRRLPLRRLDPPRGGPDDKDR